MVHQRPYNCQLCIPREVGIEIQHAICMCLLPENRRTKAPALTPSHSDIQEWQAAIVLSLQSEHNLRITAVDMPE